MPITAFTPRGIYSTDNTYAPGDLAFDGATTTYLCLLANGPGVGAGVQALSNETYWTKFAGGVVGPRGPQGNAGSGLPGGIGPTGPQGPSGALAVATTSQAGGVIVSDPSMAVDGAGNLSNPGVVKTASDNIISAQIKSIFASLASKPALHLIAAWFSGGSTATTKPHVLIEQDTVAASNWSTGGTGFGINYAAAFGGNVFDIRKDGVSILALSAAGALFLTNTLFSGMAKSIKSIAFSASPYAVLPTDDTVTVDATGGNVVITLPLSATRSGRMLTFSKIDASANTVTLTRSGADGIQGATTLALTTQWQGVTIQASGAANWLKIATA
jgi:hypothetical protein